MKHAICQVQNLKNHDIQNRTKRSMHQLNMQQLLWKWPPKEREDLHY